MKKTTFMRNLNRKTRRIIFASAAGLAAAGILAFALLFRVTAVNPGNGAYGALCLEYAPD